MVAFGVCTALIINGSMSTSRAMLIGVAIFAAAWAGAIVGRPALSDVGTDFSIWISAVISCLVALLAVVTSATNDERGRVVVAATAVALSALIWVHAVASADSTAAFDISLGALALLAIAGGLFLLPTVIGIDLTTDSGALALASQPPLWAALLIARHSRQGFVLAGLIAFLALILYEQPGDLAGWTIAGSIGALLYIRAVRLPRPDNRASPVLSPIDAGLAIIATLFLGSFLAVSLDRPVRGFLIGSLATLVAATPLVQVMILRAREGELRDLERLASSIRERARLDGLTELPNRAALDDRLAEEVERSVRYRQPLSVLFLDIDHFKSINDARGHQVGDDVLRALADTLQATVRSPDFVARYGGEEFVVIAPGTWTVDAAVLGNRIRDAVARDVPQPLGSPITMSIGIAGVPEHGQDAASVLHVADLALYAAKAGGRDRIELGFIELP